jgi:hypothetical protein
MKFHEKRRQQFLTEIAFNAEKKFFEEEAAPTYIEALSAVDSDAMDRTRNADAYADESFSLYLMRYTAGEALATLREDLDHLVFAYEQAAKYVQEYEGSTTFPPLRLIEIDEYERLLQLIGLCYLLHRRELLPRIAAIFDPSSSGRDCLYEDLLSFELEARYDVDKWYHEPYRDLINTMYSDQDEEIRSHFETYLNNWYQSLSKAPWHNSHLRIEGDMSAGYFGYWAIECGALAYLLEVDDASFREHLVYPKDLVDFARGSDRLSSTKMYQSYALRRIAGGTTCPETGYWMTPAKLDSRRYFQAGDIMPTYAQSAYGATIWQWSQAQ